MSGAAPVIVWFRQDLRLADNPALCAAIASGQPVLPLYVHDDESAGEWRIGAASRWWLHQSLAALDQSLNGRLRLLRGAATQQLPALVRDAGATAIYVNDCPEPWRREQDRQLTQMLGKDDVRLCAFNGSFLFNHDRVRTQQGNPYRVFTPFYRKGCLQTDDEPREPLPAPKLGELHAHAGSLALTALDLMPSRNWYEPISQVWQAGEAGALKRLDAFLDDGIQGYAEGRNFPNQPNVSRLSPHLHFGEISPNQVWHALTPLQRESGTGRDVDVFRSELGWREFSAYLLRHFPALPTDNLQAKFDRFPWRAEAAELERWQQGLTGIPFVDAGMRELWQTGYMHNRVRMVVGSFLVKNLLLHWHDGERWFWDTLVDADLANNSASWQWVAGSGADAAPYFRIFNPVTQGQKFDPDGSYVRRHVPELGAVPGKAVHEPWSLSAQQRRALNYPEPIVDLKASRERALAAFREI